jgi:hypothetical protein
MSETMKDESTVPREVRAALVETVEEIGQAMGLLREAAADADAGNVPGGKMSGSDALFILSELEGKFSEMCAKLAKWSEAGDAEDDAGQATRAADPGPNP